MEDLLRRRQNQSYATFEMRLRNIETPSKVEIEQAISVHTLSLRTKTLLIDLAVNEIMKNCQMKL